MSPRCSERATLKNNFQTYGAVCKVSLPEPGFGPNRCRAVCIYIYIYGVVYVVKSPDRTHQKWFAHNPTRPPMSYVIPLTHIHKCLGQTYAFNQKKQFAAKCHTTTWFQQSTIVTMYQTADQFTCVPPCALSGFSTMRDVPRQARRSSAQVKSAIERANDRAVNPRPSDRASNRARFHCPSLTLLTPNSTPRPSSKSKTIMTEPRIEVCPTLVI